MGTDYSVFAQPYLLLKGLELVTSGDKILAPMVAGFCAVWQFLRLSLRSSPGWTVLTKPKNFLNASFLQLIVTDQGTEKPCKETCQKSDLRVCEFFWQNCCFHVRNDHITEPVPPALSQVGNRSPALSEAGRSLALVLLQNVECLEGKKCVWRRTGWETRSGLLGNG